MATEYNNILSPADIYSDARGRIVALPDFPAAHSMIIESRVGAVRGNHFHNDESHLMYVVSGRMLYIEQQADGTLSTLEVRPGSAVVSPRGVAHCTVFPEETVIVVLSDVNRSGEHYEEHVFRVDALHHQVDLTGLYDGPQVNP
ncbi:cupin domain-containing protein [Dactylosporangium sp. NPDC051485]|uniref:cupin domain-containing protein n=1 Tax=Dactylosporangium sp. NPDC051485 TaxID=3154846 RepID=UPI0034221537